MGGKAGQVLGKVVEHTPHLAVGYGALKAKERLVDRGPLYRPYHVAKHRLLGMGQNYYGGGFAR